MVSSSTAVEGVNIARSNTSQSVSSRPVLGRRPAWLKNRRRVNTRNPSAVSSMQRNVTAIDKNNSSLDSAIRHLGTVGRGNSRRTCKAQPCMATCQKKNIPALTGDIHLCPPPLATHLHLRLMQLREPWAECSERAAAAELCQSLILRSLCTCTTVHCRAPGYEQP